MVKSADSGDLHVKGIHLIRLKMHNGRVAKFTEVGYILEVTKNLVSIGQLKVKGFNFRLEVELQSSKG